MPPPLPSPPRLLHHLEIYRPPRSLLQCPIQDQSGLHLLRKTSLNRQRNLQTCKYRKQEESRRLAVWGLLPP